jgi:hypothetical protein
MHRLRMLALMTGALAVLTGCAGRDAFRLVHPRAEQATDFPGGFRLLTKAPLADWEVTRRFTSRDACEQAREATIQQAIEHAHATLGPDAKDDLDVRRAVHARCVRTARVEGKER